MARGWEVISDGLACFRAVAELGCLHQPVIVDGRHAKDLPDSRWINTVISNLKTSFSGTFHALNFDKYADRYLGAFCYRFNRRFRMNASSTAMQATSASRNVTISRTAKLSSELP